MAISYVGGANGTNTATLPAFKADDVAIVFAFRDGSTTNPTIPGTFTSISNTADGTSCSASIGWRRLVASDTTVGTWTNASRTVVVVYRGCLASGTPVGGGANGAGTTNTVNYAAVTMTNSSGSSWVVGLVGHRSTDTTIDSAAISGMTNRTSGANATAEAAAWDTNGGVSSWSSTNQSISGTASGWVTRTVELLAAADPVVTATTLTSGSDGTTVSLATTASVTPSANKLQLLHVHAHPAGGPGYATVTGCGLTWVSVDQHNYDGGGGDTQMLYRALGGSPSTGALTIDFGTGNDQLEICWSLAEFGNVDTSGSDGAGAVVQAVKATGTSTTPSATLAAFGSTDNATYAAVSTGSGGYPLIAGLPNELHNFQGPTVGLLTLSEWKGYNDTTADASCVSTVWGVIAVEIKGASSLTTAAFSGSGTATVTGTGASLVKASGSITSTATATGSARTTNAAAGSITSTATATGSGRATAAAAFDSDAAAAATGVGVSTVAAAFDSDAVATVTGYPATVILSEAAGAISISAAATAYGAASASAGGYCEVECEVLGVSESEAITVRVQEGRRPKKREDDAEEISELLLAVMPQIWSHYV